MAEVETLSEDECLRLLRSRSLGRVAIVNLGRPEIFPVNYAADDRAVVFMTAPGTKLSAGPMTEVAFEVDEVDAGQGVAWSVVVKGRAQEITNALDRLGESLRQLVAAPMAPGERSHWVAVIRSEISGRRFPLSPVTLAPGAEPPPAP
jgi:uncharacterized protein